MKLVIISGRSGSGKSSALHALEDEGFYCVDNIPVNILDQLHTVLAGTHSHPAMAVSIDVRNVPGALDSFPQVLSRLKTQGIECQVVFLDADNNTLMQRYSATRRKHPLTNEHCSLSEAIEQEKRLLAPVQSRAHIRIDTSPLSVHQIRERIRQECLDHDHTSETPHMALLFESFGFKHGVPMDADFIFDVRCLPNPFWVESLRGMTGKEQPVQAFLAAEADVQAMLDDIIAFIQKWLPKFASGQRAYMTIAIGCTGGQHRSVFMAEQLAQQFCDSYQIQIRHRELAHQ